MNLRDRVHNHPVVFFLGAVILGFASGIGAYSTILSIANLKVMSESSAIPIEEVRSNYITRSEHESELDRLKQTFAQSDAKNRGQGEVVSKEQYDELTRKFERERASVNYVRFPSFDVTRIITPRVPWTLSEIEFQIAVDDVIAGDDWEHTAVLILEVPNSNLRKVTAQAGDSWEFDHNDRSFSLEVVRVTTLGAGVYVRLKSI